MSAMLEGIRSVAGAETRRCTGYRPGFLRGNGVSPWMGMPAWVPAQGDSIGFAQRDNSRALAAGLAFRPLAVTATDTLAWHRSRPEDARSLLAGISAEREQAVLQAWRERAPG
jgi:2'-hydroxyisoflavone reductase